MATLSLSSRLVRNPAGQPRSGQGCRCIVHAIVGDKGGDQRLPACPDRRPRRIGRASDPFFLPAVLWPRCGLPTPSLRHADDPQVYIPSKPALLYCPSSLRVDPFLLPSAVPKPPRLLLLLEVKLVHTVNSKRWFKQGRKWESCRMNLGLGSKRKRGKVVISVTV